MKHYHDATVRFSVDEKREIEAMYRIVIPEPFRRVAPPDALDTIVAQAESLFAHCLVRGPAGEVIWGNVGGLLANGDRVIDLPVDPVMAAGIVLPVARHRGSFDAAARIQGQFLKATAMRLVCQHGASGGRLAAGQAHLLLMLGNVSARGRTTSSRCRGTRTTAPRTASGHWVGLPRLCEWAWSKNQVRK
jgi:hypothetical protein